MKLLLSTESLVPPLAGIGNYTLNLLRALQGLAAIERIDCFTGSTLATAAEVLAALHDGSAGAGAKPGEMQWRRGCASWYVACHWPIGRMPPCAMPASDWPRTPGKTLSTTSRTSS
ncbi:hypothetical protein ACE0DR_24685 [Azotobacter sp. CWF10]